MALRRKRLRGPSPATTVPAELGDDVAPPLFGYFLEPDGQGAMRLVEAGVVLRRVGSPDAFLSREAITSARVDDEVLVLSGTDGETVFSADDTSAYPAWLAALPQHDHPRGQHDHPLPGASSRDRAAPALVGRAVRPAMLALEDGRVFRGEAFGADGESFGEAVFNTGMTGYQETLTDPSYHRQIVTMTAPHVGNTGMNAHDLESDRVWVAGFVVREPARVASSWRAERSLDAVLRDSGVVGVGGVDTRAITRHLRDRGAMRCAVSTVEADADALVQRVLESPGMHGADLAREVSTAQPYVVSAAGERRFRVAALDLGMKRSIPAYLAAAGCEVHVLPATATADDLLAVDPDGVFVSNGPGDPAATSYAVEALRGVLGRRPVFGICLGHQILGQALGLGTYKLRFGHRGLNQPVQDLATGQVAITSHNHGFAVVAPADVRVPFDSAAGRVQISHVDLNDGVVEGLRCLDVPAFSAQYHPEAAAGPHDASGLFGAFTELMSRDAVRA
jgi:carbamoyl-phosphate synthase small subunit